MHMSDYRASLTSIQDTCRPTNIPIETQRSRRIMTRVAIITGRLKFTSGIKTVYRDGNLWRIKHENLADTAETVINTTKTTSGSLSPEAGTLICNIVDNGLAVRDPFGGISINPSTNQAISPNGRETEGLYAIGECTVGSLYYISAMTKIRNRSQSIAKAISNRG